MLKELFIKNLAVIDEMRLQFHAGFQVLTGETGAGKSILIESMGLVLGEKANISLIRDGSEEAIVEAVCSIQGIEAVEALLSEYSLNNEDDADELIIRRVLRKDGQNKVFINCQRASLGQLKAIAKLLFDLTGQRDQNVLLQPAEDRRMVDAFLPPKQLRDYVGHFKQAKQLWQEITDFKQAQSLKNDRIQWLKFQMKELDAIPVANQDEYAALIKQREQLKHGQAIHEFVQEANRALTQGGSNSAAMILNLMEQAKKIPYLVDEHGKLLTQLESIKIQIEDVAFEISKAFTNQLSQGTSLDSIESKLYKIEVLKRKHGPELEDLFRKRDEMKAEIESLENSEQHLEDLEKRFNAHFMAVKEDGTKLTKARGKAAKQLEKSVLQELEYLKMPQVRFEVSIESAKGDVFEDYNAHGSDNVRFLLSPNPGLSLRPLAKVASGGETSRIYLALKQILNKERQGGTLIFDEIDTGISGAVVQLVGNKLKALAGKFQVFCITHHAQIASLADEHYQVMKEVKKNKTFTRVRSLRSQERVQEVARLMGGIEISQKNMEYAKELLKENSLEK
jgi:DNA repair protein RecN (Recombination protein N)